MIHDHHKGAIQPPYQLPDTGEVPPVLGDAPETLADDGPSVAVLGAILAVLVLALAWGTLGSWAAQATAGAPR